MLSLALEFASITTSSEEASANGPKQVDQDLRDESIAELANAIESKKIEVQNMEVELAMVHAPEDNEATRADIAEAKAVLTDMEERVRLFSTCFQICISSLYLLCADQSFCFLPCSSTNCRNHS